MICKDQLKGIIYSKTTIEGIGIELSSMKRTCLKAWTRNLNSHSLHSASGGGRGAQGRPFDIHMTSSNKDHTTAIVVSFNNGAKHDKYKSVYRAQGITTTGRGRGRGREEESRALHSPPPLMASSLGLSSSFSSSSTFNNPITQHRKKLFLVPCLSTRHNFSSNSDQEKKNPNLTNSDKKSLSVATGELFLGIASRIIKRTSANSERREFYFPRRNNNRVATVLDSSIDAAAAEEVLWDRRMKDFGDFELEDHTNNGGTVAATGFSFSAAGLLFPYHLGVAQYLIEKGYINETTPLAGSSAGAIVCAVVASGSSMQEALDATKILAEDCRLKGTAFRLGAVLRDVLVKFLPDDVHTRSNGRVRVAVTQILWRPRGLLVDQFDSKEDLINAVFTSSFIPGYLAPRPATLFRNRLCVDGGLTLFMPPTSATKTVRICAFPTERLGLQDVGISPDCNPDNRATPRQLFKWALEPADDHVLDRLFEVGYLDAAVWAERNLVEEIVADDRNIVSP